MFLFVNLVTALSFFSDLSSFNYLAFSIPALGLFVDFFNRVLYFYYCGLLENFRYPFLACHSAIFLLNTV